MICIRFPRMRTDPSPPLMSHSRAGTALLGVRISAGPLISVEWFPRNIDGRFRDLPLNWEKRPKKELGTMKKRLCSCADPHNNRHGRQESHHGSFCVYPIRDQRSYGIQVNQVIIPRPRYVISACPLHNTRDYSLIFFESIMIVTGPSFARLTVM
jgi:hypothetical protein